MGRSLRLGFLLSVSVLALTAGADEPARAAGIRFELVLAAPSKAPLSGSLVLAPEDSSAARVVLPVRGDRVLSAQLPPGTRWQVSLEVPGYWARPEILAVDAASAETARKIAVWPLGTIAGRVRLADPTERLPKEIAVATVQPASRGTRRSSPRQRLVCPVDEQGVWRCNLPATTFDLSLSAQGFIPHYRWGVEVPAGGAVVLGTLELKRGASVAGWAAVEGGSLAAGRCFARLEPLVAPGGGRGVADRLRSTAQEAAVGKDGFFQLAGVAPGAYRLEVEQPEFAPATAFPIEVWPGAETLVEQPPLTGASRVRRTLTRQSRSTSSSCAARSRSGGSPCRRHSGSAAALPCAGSRWSRAARGSSMACCPRVGAGRSRSSLSTRSCA